MPSLAKYREMRDFERTREPRGKALQRRDEALSFVVQKHDARNLHYDFRLELDGVLLSWAVPKGPSLDPGVTRLAMEVEPHPLEYRDFEGAIPKGEYGAGTVMVWDRGTWKPEGDPRQGLKKGHLAFTLQGQKLQGAWHLVRTKRQAEAGQGSRDGKGWLLFKSRDEAARADGDQLLRESPESALSGRELEQIAAAPEAEWRRDGRVAFGAPAPNEAHMVKLGAQPRPAAKLPRVIEPELATLVDSAPAGDDWIHEIKFDGYRVHARLEQGQVTLLTRSGKDWSERMPTLRETLQQLAVESAYLDGELVALDDEGHSDFQALQNSLSEGRDGALVYYAFDLLHLDGTDLTAQPLLERKSRLRQLLAVQPEPLGQRVRFSAHVVGNGAAFFENASKLGLEGIIAKRALSTYRSGRGRDWLKIKCSQRQEFVVVGYTEPAGSRSHLGALLLGVREGDKLRYAGRVGTGFSQASLGELHEKLAPLTTKEAPVENPPRGADARGVHWVEPRLVAEVGYTEMTSDGSLRHPTFHGLRDDKPAREVRLEASTKVEQPRAKPAQLGLGPQPPTRQPSYPITNPDKVLYPESGITKRELLDYYALVAERMLPHVENRPLTLVRAPNGIGKQTFFQKHPGKGTPAGLRSVDIREKEGKHPYSVIDDAQGLFGLVQLGALEIHTWGSRADDFEHPDVLVFDLDPDPALEYAAVIQGALTVRRIFEQAKLESFVKTTGGKGLHVCVPIAPDLDWEQAKDFTGRIAEAIAADAPQLYLATASKAKRKGKTYIDYLRNARGATFIAPYSTRAREQAPIAVPLEWDELSPKLGPNHFTLRNIAARLAQLRRDPFEGLARSQQRLRPASESATTAAKRRPKKSR
ncbi:MAG TPA: DNA ligase D [Polyangiaceae bacterium]